MGKFSAFAEASEELLKAIPEDDAVSRIECILIRLWNLQKLREQIEVRIDAADLLAAGIHEMMLTNRLQQLRLGFLSNIFQTASKYATIRERLIVWKHQLERIPTYIELPEDIAVEYAERVNEMRYYWKRECKKAIIDIEHLDLPLQTVQRESHAHQKADSNRELEKLTDVQTAIFFRFLFAEAGLPSFNYSKAAAAIRRISGRGSDNMRKYLSDALRKSVTDNQITDLATVRLLLRDIGFVVSDDDLMAVFPLAKDE